MGTLKVNINVLNISSGSAEVYNRPSSVEQLQYALCRYLDTFLLLTR